MTVTDPLQPHLDRWDLVPDGEAIATPSSQLLPVRSRGEPAMLKVALHEEERRGAGVMAWWGGRGAARVLARDGDALLMERIAGGRSLSDLARADDAGDDEATRLLCAVAARLHDAEGRPPPPVDLPDLPTWFRALAPGAARHGDRLPLLRAADAVARELLDDPRDVVVLHGDLHHGNVLDAARGGAGHVGTGGRGWLAIDPKGIVGERGFDHANLFRNPDPTSAARPGRLARQADVAAQAAGLDRDRLLRWVLALCGLSAAWHLEDGTDPGADLAVGALALYELGRR